MKSKLLKFGLLFLVAIVASVATIVNFSASENVKSNTQKDVVKTNENVVDQQKLDTKSNDFIVKNQNDASNNSVVSKIQTISDENHQVVENEKSSTEIDVLRAKHQELLDKELFKKTLMLSRKERKAAGLPPNKYAEVEWALTMNPALGRPTPENLTKIREELEKVRQNALTERTPGDGLDNPWIERGPNNVGGRTKALLFDPTDATFKTVIAGGVSGGLWKNTDITTATNWTRMTLPEHLNVQSITVDPNNSSIWYVGTGESYTSGDANGNGIWKSTNAGNSWFRVFGGGTVTSTPRAVYNLQIISPSNAGVIRGYVTSLASFGNPITNFTAPIALVNDGNTTTPAGSTTDDACSALTVGSLTGKIALIRRGQCSFESKALAAQNAGAVGVIIMNNVAGGGVLGMASSSLGATVPTIMVSKEDGDLLVANLANLTGSFQPTGPGEFTGLEISNVQYINDLAIKNNGGVSEIYAAVGDSYNNGGYANASNYGLYKSINGGTTWTKLTLPVTPSGNQTCPMDIEIAFGGKIWVSSTESATFGDGGGKIFVSTDNGATFTTKHTIVGNGGGGRTEIEASNTTADKIYVLAQLNQADAANPTIEVQILRTTDGFTTAPTVLTLPADNDTRSATYGFTGAQSFYNLFIESDPSNDANLFVGGLNILKSTNSGTSWAQISQWNGGNLVHSDQHAMTFRPGTPNSAVFGNDGGVYYCASLSTATNTSSAMVERNNGYNVTQFVGVAVMPQGVAGVTGDFFVAGAQDNGSNYFPSSKSTTTGDPLSVNASTEVQGGDGGIPLFAQDSDKYYVTNYVYNDNMNVRGLNGAATKVLSDGTLDRGLFYPAMGLDSANDIVYSDFTDGTNRVYYVRRYSAYRAVAAATRTDLTSTLLTSYPTAISPGKATPTTLYVGTANSRFLKLVNANTAIATSVWTDITGPSFVGSISDISFGATDNQIFVTMSNYGVTSIWYTLNGGTNWYSLEGNLPDMPVKAILQNPLVANELMIGTELGVWYTVGFNPATSANQALTWYPSFNGMSNVKVTDLDLQPNSPTAPTAYNVFASTYGRGVFSSQLWFCGATTTTWNGTAWSNGVPTSKTAVVFSGNFTSTASLDACSITVNTGVTVTIATGHTLRVGDNITVNGTGSLVINNDAALIQNAKHAVNTGNIVVKRNSTAMIQNDYTAWSSPVVNQNLLAFSPGTAVSRFYQYLFTGTTTPTAYQSVTPSTNSFLPGKGYMIRVATAWSPTVPTVFNGQFTGVPNNGSITYTVGQGYNLLGNPYPSPIDATSLIKTNGKLGALYYWSHKVAASGGVYPSNNYASYSLLGGVASANGSAIPNDKIQVGQGFFVNAIGAFDVKFENELRVDAVTTTQFFRSGRENTSTNEVAENHRVWLNLNGKTTGFNQILVGYSSIATNNFDDNVDALMFDTSKTFLYNVLDNKELVIQGKALPFTDSDVVKLGLKVIEAGELEINIQQVDGLFTNQDIYVKDKYSNVIHNLKESAYKFTTEAGTFNDRFELIYKNANQEVLAISTVDLFVKNNDLTIQSNQSAISSIEVFDVLGKLIFTKTGIKSKQFNTNQITANNQALIVKIQLENGEVVVKKMVM